VKYQLLLSDFNENFISSKYFRKNSNFKFSENPYNESRVAPCGRTDRQPDMTKLIVVFRNFSKASKYKN